MRIGLSRLRKQIAPFMGLAGLDRPLELALLTWPVLWALWLAAGGPPTAGQVLLVLTAWVLGRTAVCALSNWLDGRLFALDPAHALAAALSSALGVTVLLATAGGSAWVSALIGFALVGIYPVLRRHSHLAQLVLAVGYGAIAPAVFAATAAGLSRQAWLMYAVLTLWAAASATIAALGRRESDAERGRKSTALLFGDGTWGLVGILYGVMFLALVLLGSEPQFGVRYYGAVAVAAGLSLVGASVLRQGASGIRGAKMAQNIAGAVLLAGMTVGG